MQSVDDASEAGIDASVWAETEASDAIEGAEYARAYLARLQAGMATPDDLAVLMAFLSGEMLAGACRVIEKALGGRK